VSVALHEVEEGRWTNFSPDTPPVHAAPHASLSLVAGEERSRSAPSGSMAAARTSVEQKGTMKGVDQRSPQTPVDPTRSWDGFVCLAERHSSEPQ